MLIKDSPVLERHSELDPLLEQQYKAANLLAERFVKGDLFNRNHGDIAHQMRSGLTATQLEAKIDKLAGGPGKFHYVHHPFKPELKCIYAAGRQDKPVIYMAGLMPEYDVMEPVWEWVSDPDWGTKENPVTEADMDSENPGFVKKQQGEITLVRGWRTVLVRLAEEGWLPVEAVLREFPDDGRSQGWNHFLKGNADSPLVA
jgi:hypothetical protein